jgi:K+ transporter
LPKPDASGPNQGDHPLALRAEVEYTNTFHERVLIVAVEQVSIPRLDDEEWFTVERLGGIFTAWHVTLRVGYQEKLNVPAALNLCRKQACSRSLWTSSTPSTSCRG